MLTGFRLKKSWIAKPGGSKSQVAEYVDTYLCNRGWEEKSFKTQVIVDDEAKSLYVEE